MIVDSLNGCLAPAFEVGQLAMKVDQLFANAHLVLERRDAARKTAESLFAMATCVEAYQNLYSEISV